MDFSGFVINVAFMTMIGVSKSSKEISVYFELPYCIYNGYNIYK